jgi:hypothetical protein
MVNEVRTGRKPAQIVWASVWLDERGQLRRSKLIIMARDPDAPKGGYSTKSYIEALTKGLLLTTDVLSCSCRIMRVFTPLKLQSVGWNLSASGTSNGQHIHQTSTQLNTFGGTLRRECLNITLD